MSTRTQLGLVSRILGIGDLAVSGLALCCRQPAGALLVVLAVLVLVVMAVVVGGSAGGCGGGRGTTVGGGGCGVSSNCVVVITSFNVPPAKAGAISCSLQCPISRQDVGIVYSGNLSRALPAAVSIPFATFMMRPTVCSFKWRAFLDEANVSLYLPMPREGPPSCVEESAVLDLQNCRLGALTAPLKLSFGPNTWSTCPRPR